MAGVKEGHPGVIKAPPLFNEAHSDVVEAHNGVMEAYIVMAEAHP